MPNLPYVELFGERIPRQQDLAVSTLTPAFARLTRKIMQAYPDTPIVTNYKPFASYLANRNLLELSEFDTAVVVSFAPRCEHDGELPTLENFNHHNLFLGIPEDTGAVDMPVEMHFSRTYMYQVNMADVSRVTVNELVVAFRYER